MESSPSPKFFSCSREDALRAVELLGAQQCAYTWGVGEPDDQRERWREGRCDCKYGGPKPRLGTEDTGCPELRTVAALLRVMDDTEFEQLVVDGGGLNLRTTLAPEPPQ
jgi:hypothetical protein